MAGSGGPFDKSGGASSRPRTVVIIDATRAPPGHDPGDELCEIDGVGAVSVAAATELIGEGGLQYVIKEGFDVKTVTRSTDRSPSASRSPSWSETGLCRPGLWQTPRARTRPLAPRLRQRRPDRAGQFGPALSRAPSHEDQWRLALEGGPGHWRWVGPADPPSAGRIARNRKVATAKAKAGVIGGSEPASADVRRRS